MKCTFTYKNGRVFNSEIALDEFIANSLKYDNSITDAVFELNTKQKSIKSIVLARDADAKLIMKDYGFVRIDTDLYEDYDAEFFPPGHIPVTKALAEYRDENGDLLFPFFDEENYWKNKLLEDWNDISYWKRTRNAGKRMASLNEINAVFGEGVKPKDIVNLPTPEQIKRGRELISASWPLLGFIGTGIHRMFEAYWNAVNHHIKDDEKLKQALVESLYNNYSLGLKRCVIPPKFANNPKYSKYKDITFDEIINNEIIESTLKACKKLHEELNNKFKKPDGGELLFLPEVSAITSINDLKGNNTTNLIGNFDLLVVDSDGNIQLIDYKTSPKNYVDYDSAKKRTFSYLLATYRRMIERMQIPLDGNSKVYVAPIKFNKFQLHPIDLNKDDLKNLLSLESVELESLILEELNIKGDGTSNISYNIDQILPLERTEIVDGDILDAVDQFTKHKFSTFAEQQEVTVESTKRMLKDKGADKPKKNSKKFVFTYNGKTYKKDTFEELIAAVHKVREDVDAAKSYISGLTQEIKSKLREAMIHPGTFELTKASRLETILDQYASADYEILDNYSTALESLGIILIRNKYSKMIDVLVVDTSAHLFTEKIKLTYGKTLVGSFNSDVIAKNKPDELVLASTYGNIKLMQVCAALNEITNTLKESGSIVGHVMLFNLASNSAFTASNEELQYNFRELCKLDKEHITENNLTKVKFANKLSLAKLKMKEILSNPPNRKFKRIALQSALSDLDTLPVDDMISIRNKLVDLTHTIEEEFGLEHNTKAETLNDLNKRQAYELLMDIYNAIGECDGVKFKQQLQDHSKYLNLAGAREALTRGWSGNSLDNPGMLDSDLLNLVGKQVNIAYQNVRDETLLVAKKLFELGEKLRAEKSFGYLKSRTFGNEASLFKNMYDEDYENDLVFKNPFNDNTMTDIEKEYLSYCLLQINNRRYGIKTMEDLKTAINSEGYKYLKVPLMRGSFSSKVANKGLTYALKDSFSKLIPNEKNLQEFFNGFLTDDDAIEQSGDKDLKNRLRKAQNKDFELWEMSSRFDAYEKEEYRRRVLADPKDSDDKIARGVDFFERNLEVLTTAHSFSYIMKDNINKIFPVLKAIGYQLEYQGFILNHKFAEDIEYLHNFITAKILNMSIQDPKWHELSYVASKVMSGASKLALAFNPRLLYQAIDGIWKDIMLVLKNPDGTEAFSAKNFKDSFFWVYKELGHSGNNKSLVRMLNEVYGINDMDMNTYNLKILPNLFGMFNFSNLAFHFASRPDFYNRMTIFGAHMRADGCFEAHDKEGNYDWTKDKRYSIFAEYVNKENEIPAELKVEYNKQKARYAAVAKQFVNENAKYINDKGELVDFYVDLNNPIALPRAYTVQEAESIKSIADMVYGYYSHEKKSLIQSTTAGALFMQMNTFWSSKKNQFMAPGGIRMVGKWVQYEEDGKKYYVDENGEPTTEETNTPFMIWQGQYQEGIFVTLANILRDSKDKGIIESYKSYVNNEDENLRTAYRSNMHLLWYDLLMMLILGMIIAPALQNAAKDYTKEVGNENLGDAVINMATLNLTAMLKTSTEDFFFMNTIFGRGVQWTPFSVTTMTNTVKRISSCISGNTDLYDTLVKLGAITRTRESVLDCVKINTLGRPIGDNGRKDD